MIDGVADYGNKIGLPTIAGAVLYDAGFTTNPLVFCGCIGVAAERPLPDGPFPGDRVVVLGGRTGRDGIRGATFSSATMDATTGEVAGASVQIGDPVTEKLLIDVLTGADELWTAITDCGAGGLSSAVGEMADGVGADVELTAVPLKYPGLAPWEVWLSEAQERMVVAVPPDRLAALRARCDRHGVELADLGAFTGDGRLVVRHDGDVVLDLDTTFLHDGRPQRQMTAEIAVPTRQPAGRTVDDPASTLLALLAHRNIASKAATIHRYDHEIGGGTAVRPLVGVEGDGPGDGVVLADPRDTHGIAVGIGVNPWYGLHDPEAMAHAVGRRGDPQRRRRRRRSRSRRPARQLLVGRSAPAEHARRAGGGRARVSRRGDRQRRPVRVRQGLAEQRVRRRRRPAPRRPADAGDHGRRPRARRRAHRDRRAHRARQRARAARANRTRVRRQPPRPRARRAGRDRCRPTTGPRRTGPLPPPARGDPRRPRPVLPRRQRGRAGGRPGRAVHLRPAGGDDRPAPPRRPGDGAVRRVHGAPRRRGPTRRRRCPRGHSSDR